MFDECPVDFRGINTQVRFAQSRRAIAAFDSHQTCSAQASGQMFWMVAVLSGEQNWVDFGDGKFRTHEFWASREKKFNNRDVGPPN